MKTKSRFLFVISLLFMIVFINEAFAKKETARYFKTISGERIDFSRVTKVTHDTVYISIKGKQSFLLVDSIAGYYHYKKGKAGIGLIFGFASGLVIGSIVGAIAASGNSDPNAGITASEARETTEGKIAIIGGAAGGLIGFIVGLNMKEDISIDYRTWDKNKKLISLQDILPKKYER